MCRRLRCPLPTSAAALNPIDTVCLVSRLTDIGLLSPETLQTTCLEVLHLTRRAAVAVRYLLDRVADNNRRYLVDSHIQAALDVEALLEEPA